jgi:hypothetical protein
VAKLRISEFMLQTGSWASSLGLLRQLDCPSKRLFNAKGGESLYISISHIGRFEREVFEQGYPMDTSLSLAEKYIRGEEIPNPVVTLSQELGVK